MFIAHVCFYNYKGQVCKAAIHPAWGVDRHPSPTRLQRVPGGHPPTTATIHSCPLRTASLDAPHTQFNIVRIIKMTFMRQTIIHGHIPCGINPRGPNPQGPTHGRGLPPPPHDAKAPYDLPSPMVHPTYGGRWEQSIGAPPRPWTLPGPWSVAPFVSLSHGHPVQFSIISKSVVQTVKTD